ncbi:MAG TPA: metal ABC transporter ATP-binding protein [Candidatus Baltobacteraceae bacterium]|nr:metal ABC transporter ATP-binding protein [Candidatus Baltobacteraceae bacterium]
MMVRQAHNDTGVAVVARDLVVCYDHHVALDHATVNVQFGEALGIVGPNGSGKSTFLKAIAGLLEPASGTLDVLGEAPRSLPAGSIAYVPQIEDVDWTFPATVWDVVAMGRFPRLGMFRRFGKDDRAAVERGLDLVNMRHLAFRHISALSGGQQQRVFVARAIAQEPKLLLLDEPTTGVDAQTEAALRKVIRELVHGGMPVIMSTHHLERASEWFDRLLVLNKRVVAIGTPDEVLASGAYAELHGQMHVHGHGAGERHQHD